jgi:hypothetical protein
MMAAEGTGVSLLRMHAKRPNCLFPVVRFLRTVCSRVDWEEDSGADRQFWIQPFSRKFNKIRVGCGEGIFLYVQDDIYDILDT